MLIWYKEVRNKYAQDRKTTIIMPEDIVHHVSINELPDTKAYLLGEYIPNILSIEQDEKNLKIMMSNDYKGHMYYVFANGKVAKIPMQAYETKGFRRKMQNAYSNKSPLVNLFYGEEEIFIKFTSNDDRVAIVDTSMLNSIGSRSSVGVQCVKLTKRVTIVSSEKIPQTIEVSRKVENEDSAILKETIVIKNQHYFQQVSKSIPAVFRTVNENEPVQEKFLDI